MTYAKTIVCLANSRKPPSGRCVAGRERHATTFGSWVRPVSERESREVSEEERRYEDGTDPQVLDIITIQMKRPLPHNHQQENHLLDDGYYWKKSGRLSWTDVLSAVDAPQGDLWANGYSTRHGCNDQVPESAIAGYTSSLYLVKPEDLRIVVGSDDNSPYPNRRRVRAHFKLNGVEYHLVVTDPPVEREYFARNDGEYPISEAVICVSLAEPFNGYAYKLAAAVITPERAGHRA
ncbi:MAG: dual OB domain-containing protein [Myxococcota bacterium]